MPNKLIDDITGYTYKMFGGNCIVRRYNAELNQLSMDRLMFELKSLYPERDISRESVAIMDYDCFGHFAFRLNPDILISGEYACNA